MCFGPLFSCHRALCGETPVFPLWDPFSLYGTRFPSILGHFGPIWTPPPRSQFSGGGYGFSGTLRSQNRGFPYPPLYPPPPPPYFRPIFDRFRPIRQYRYIGFLGLFPLEPPFWSARPTLGTPGGIPPRGPHPVSQIPSQDPYGGADHPPSERGCTVLGTLSLCFHTIFFFDPPPCVRPGLPPPPFWTPPKGCFGPHFDPPRGVFWTPPIGVWDAILGPFCVFF
jgi:hypothetical protein